METREAKNSSPSAAPVARLILQRPSLVHSSLLLATSKGFGRYTAVYAHVHSLYPTCLVGLNSCILRDKVSTSLEEQYGRSVPLLEGEAL
jgi:hypothetical protein